MELPVNMRQTIPKNLPFLYHQGKKLGFVSSSRSGPALALYQWLLKFKGLLVAKFGLYFYDVLSKQAPSSELKNIMAKTSVDFFGK